ncbi:hypothetical protein [Antarcticirhabdus aurantiaca]|uniref:Uncharacterized protein n=1 Tax=Antarcticirhabdus aurantiaca TaxID=2606717 RepID=A0ACD4NT73_9HYPH|nr:hypothetical protein [Antarcticirhabdus aurantiaca]WAJ29973.1 hypothetical protein OXU80_07115 [Jeongeuplla avenae]
MIPLAQYLSEIGPAEPAFASASGLSPLKRKPVFERLSLVERPPANHEIEFRPLNAVDDVLMDETAFEPLGGFGAMSLDGFDADLENAFEMGDGEVEAEPEVDHEAMLAQARADGEAEGRAAMRAEMEAAFAAERASLEARFAAEREAALAQARADWASAEGEKLAGLLSDQADRIGLVIRESFGAVLKPLARGARERQTIAEIVETVSLLSGDGKALAMRAAGPRDLLDALKKALPARQAALIAFVDEAEAVELRIQADATVIETRLTDWRRALNEALS